MLRFDYRLDSYRHIICARFYYGGDCSRRCMPDPERYACDANGYKKCRQGVVQCCLSRLLIDAIAQYMRLYISLTCMQIHVVASKTLL